MGIDENRSVRKKNFVFLGEGGSGKSELALNWACILNQKFKKDEEVHIFDLDQTKPLFRARDVQQYMEKKNIKMHFEKQFYDAPTMTGGVSECLKNEKCFVILDVGGNHTGARMIGGFSSLLNQPDTEVYFVINPYRPWSQNVVSVDQTLSSILQVSRIQKVKIISNPNVGATTKAEEVLAGHQKVKAMIEEYMPISCLCVREELYEEIRKKTDTPVIPVELRMQSETLEKERWEILDGDKEVGTWPE